jgi:LytS/YehU family sensor histidine kinase
VTHGVAHLLEGGTVRVAARAGVAAIAITVDNPCDPDRSAGRGAGMGLANVRERLRTLYGTDARLSTAEQDGRYVARIELPLDVEREQPLAAGEA